MTQHQRPRKSGKNGNRYWGLVFYFRLVPIPNSSDPINCFPFVKHQRSKEVDHLQRSGTAVMKILEKELFCFGNQFFSFFVFRPLNPIMTEHNVIRHVQLLTNSYFGAVSVIKHKEPKRSPPL